MPDDPFETPPIVVTRDGWTVSPYGPIAEMKREGTQFHPAYVLDVDHDDPRLSELAASLEQQERARREAAVTELRRLFGTD